MSAFRTLCSKVHLYVGLALSLLLVVLSLTGSALVFRDAIDRALNPELLQVDPGGERIGLAQVLRRVQTAYPRTTPQLIEFPRVPDQPYTVWLKGEKQAYVDPYRGTVLGLRSSEEGAMNVLFALHAELLAGQTGAWIVGVSGLLLVLLSGTGLVLWWPALRMTRRRMLLRLTLAWRHGWTRLNYDLHRAGGFYTALFVLLVALTGSGLIFYESTGAALSWVTGSPPSLPPPPSSQAIPASSKAAITPDAAVAAAARALPDAAMTFLYLPQTKEAPVTVRLRTPGEWHPNGRSFTYVDQYSGEVLRVDDAREAPQDRRVLHTLYPLHIGAVGGPLVRILYLVLGLAPTVLVVTGTVIWYNRWRKKCPSPDDASLEKEVIPARPVAAELPGARRQQATPAESET